MDGASSFIPSLKAAKSASCSSLRSAGIFDHVENGASAGSELGAPRDGESPASGPSAEEE
jgi:hypothetical protein